MALNLTVGPQIREVLLRFTTTKPPQELVQSAKHAHTTKRPRGMTVFEMTARPYGVASLLRDIEAMGFRLTNMEVFHRETLENADPTSSRFSVRFYLSRDAKKKVSPPDAERGRKYFAELAKEKWCVMAHINPAIEDSKVIQGANLSVSFSFRSEIGAQALEEIHAEAFVEPVS